MPDRPLVDRLWGEEPPPTATTSLQNTVSRLRKLLGADRLDHQAARLRRSPRTARSSTSPASSGSSAPRASCRPSRGRRRCVRRWRSGAGRRSPTSSTSRSPSARSRGWKSFAPPCSRTGSTPTSSGAAQRARRRDRVARCRVSAARAPARAAHARALPLRPPGRGACRPTRRRGRCSSRSSGSSRAPALQELERAILRQEDALAPAPALPALADHYRELLDALLAGRLVPVPGSGVNVFGRAEDAPWATGHPGAPDGRDVAAYLADCFECPREHARELARLSQYVAVTRGVGPLHDELHALFDADFEPGPIHALLARLPAYLRERGAAAPRRDDELRPRARAGLPRGRRGVRRRLVHRRRPAPRQVLAPPARAASRG